MSRLAREYPDQPEVWDNPPMPDKPVQVWLNYSAELQARSLGMRSTDITRVVQWQRTDGGEYYKSYDADQNAVEIKVK